MNVHVNASVRVSLLCMLTWLAERYNYQWIIVFGRGVSTSRRTV